MDCRFNSYCLFIAQQLKYPRVRLLSNAYNRLSRGLLPIYDKENLRAQQKPKYLPILFRSSVRTEQE
jgi:hypothetical protein